MYTLTRRYIVDTSDSIRCILWHDKTWWIPLMVLKVYSDTAKHSWHFWEHWMNTQTRRNIEFSATQRNKADTTHSVELLNWMCTLPWGNIVHTADSIECILPLVVLNVCYWHGEIQHLIEPSFENQRIDNHSWSTASELNWTLRCLSHHLTLTEFTKSSLQPPSIGSDAEQALREIGPQMMNSKGQSR